MAKVDISDRATPFLQDMIKNKPIWVKKAMQSTGLYVRKEIKDGIKSGAPGGVRYAKFMPAEMRAKLEKSGKKTFSTLGKMANAVRSKYDPSNLSVSVGWLSKSAIKRGEKIESGQVDRSRRKCVTISSPEMFLYRQNLQWLSGLVKLLIQCKIN